MGTALSSGGGNRAGGPGAPGPQGPPRALPPQPPYHGNPVLYRQMHINATYGTHVEQYYAQLAAMYEQGYRMLMFVTYPAAKQSEALKFQGIFRRAFPAEEGRQWQLRVEKSSFISKQFQSYGSYGCTSDSIHIVQALKRITDTGGRLVSMALAGSISTQLSWQRFLMVGEMEEECEYPYWSDSVNKTSANQVGVNLFYEMPPSGGGGGPYIYQVVPCPISSQLNLGIPRHNWVSTIPWETVISQYLGSGWKLVEIFEDHAASKNTNVQKMFSFNIRLQNNLLWIFEKPASRRDDPTPLYECTMVETWKVNAVDYDGVFTNVGVSTNLSTNWDPLLDHYGRSGWQVVRIIDTPDAQRQGLVGSAIHQRQLVFFQRLREGFVEDGFGNPSYLRPDAPPAYDEVHAAPSRPPIAPSAPGIHDLKSDKH
ncbi:uncharacterized protein LOC128218003 [Mya arenaria]|uniref:uncharacterized protein LOC128218003 n=1 Tax=Mya arenaria TaxID=6604 RepID=UPI0022E98A13|nr:uncharacterized protein LOC128218003 [Mya arenaria]XP_052781454.1 uncharacterized protein LOC128218003 [Mya arenaria]